jgi:hypothetical protein
MVRLHPVQRPPRQGHLRRQALAWLALGMSDSLHALTRSLPRLARRLPCPRRERRPKRLDDIRIDGSGRKVLTHADPLGLAQVVAQVTGALFIWDHHLMATLPTIDAAGPHGFAGAGDPAGVGALVFRVMVVEQPLDLLRGLPAEIGRVRVVNAAVPRLPGEAWLPGVVRTRTGPDRPGPSPGKRPRIGGILHGRAHRGHGRFPPDDSADAITPGALEPWHIEGPPHFVGGTEPDKGRKGESQPALDLALGGFLHDPVGGADEAHGQRQREVPTRGVVPQAGRQPRPDGLELQRGDLSLEASQHTAVRTARIVAPSPLGAYTGSLATQVQEGRPIRTVASEAGAITRPHKAYGPSGDLGAPRLTAFAVCGAGSGGPKSASDNLDGRRGPPSLPGALLQRIRHPPALVIAKSLMRAGVTNVDHRVATQMLWGNPCGCGHR